MQFTTAFDLLRLGLKGHSHIRGVGTGRRNAERAASRLHKEESNSGV